MNVYHNGNENCWEPGSRENKLNPLPINQTFLWEEQELFLPAVYVGRAGVVLDVCAKIPLEEMRLFLKKWDKKRRLSLRTSEEFEQMEMDNPGSREFFVELCLDHTPLTLRSFSSLRWYPVLLEEEWQNDKNAEKLMEVYGLDRECCWHFGRLVYDWKGAPMQAPCEASLLFHTRLRPVTAEHFATDSSCGGEQLEIIHPTTGQKYTLTLHRLEQEKVGFTDIGIPNMRYPEYVRALSYSVQPEISRELLDIRDCAEGDQPWAERGLSKAEKDLSKAAGDRTRTGGVPKNTARIGGRSSMVFMTGKETGPQSRVTFSSLRFEPVSEVHWRVIFQIKNKKDMKIHFSL